MKLKKSSVLNSVKKDVKFNNLNECKDSDVVLRLALKYVKKDVDFKILNALCDYLYNNGSDSLNSEDISEFLSIIHDIDC